MQIGGQRQAPEVLPPGKRPNTVLMGGWFWSGGGRKITPTPGFAPRTVQSLASRYTD